MNPPNTPYFATIVSTEFSGHDLEGYEAYREELSALVAKQPGFLRADLSFDQQKTISLTYWESEDAMVAWSKSPEHQEITKRSHAGGWYKSLRLEIAQVNTVMEFPPRKL